MSSNVRVVLLSLSMLASNCISSTSAQVARPAIGLPARGGAAEKPATPWNEAEIVFVGKLDRVIAGPVGNSLPPVYSHTLHFSVSDAFRSDLKRGANIVAAHSARQHKPPVFPEGKTCVVAASVSRERMRVLRIEQADENLIKSVRRECTLPLGWKAIGERAISPWASMGKKAWNVDEGPHADTVCNVTSRPALLAGVGAQFTVEKVPPTKAIKWTNPDGDGEYKISLTNTTGNPLKVPALLTDGKKILWDDCLVVQCQGKAYVCPGAQGVSGNVQALELKPGETVSTVVNALRLKGPEWPRGGYRIEFQFCLGEKSQTKSFYYMSRHHDALRKAATKES